MTTDTFFGRSMAEAIVVGNLSKRYRIGHTIQGAGPRTLRDALERLAAKASGWLGRRPAFAEEDFWALRDVGFAIEQGETVGVVGRNGAGKSTLLKIISLITRPTTGRLKVVGRVGSLLEVGVGFHAELSGRDNVFLSGAVLGMGRRQIARKLDEIVAFAEVEEFFDTPIKRYSSGMLARLGFAVAAHLESEILIVDEALSVGDIPFQGKCAERMGRLAEEGRTVLFVSHSMSALSGLCRRGLFLERGRLLADGKIEDVVAAYLKSLESALPPSRPPNARRGGPAANPDAGSRPGKGEVRILEVTLHGDDGEPTAWLTVGCAARVVIRVSAARPGLVCAFSVHTQGGQTVARFDSAAPGPGDVTDPSLGDRLLCDLDPLLLAPGHYRVNARLVLDGELEDHFSAAAAFEVMPGTVGGRPAPFSPHGGVIVPHRWTLPG
jgi:lipopolysaccharide transport system ATP-binding protein